MLIQVLGTGCPKCQKLEAQTRMAASRLKLDCEVVKVAEITAIMNMGVLMTPALAVDGRVLFSGKVPSVEELEDILRPLTGK